MAFRFMPHESAEMEQVLIARGLSTPSREEIQDIATRFNASAERANQKQVAWKQVWNWFQNRRQNIRNKGLAAQERARQQSVALLEASRTKPPSQTIPQPMVSTIPHPVPHSLSHSIPQHVPQNLPQPVPQFVPHPIPHSMPQPVPQSVAYSVPQPVHPVPQPVHPVPQHVPQPVPQPPHDSSNALNDMNSQSVEFEAKSNRDNAWYDVEMFVAHRKSDKGEQEVLVRFVGFGVDDDEWISALTCVRQRSLPCEASECIGILPGDLVLCFQEGNDQALYFDADVVDVQRRRHDVRGCRCRFWVKYRHDNSEEVVPLRKICRRPETEYRLQAARQAQAILGSKPVASNLPGILPNTEPAVSANKASGLPMPEPAASVINRQPNFPVVFSHVPNQNTGSYAKT